MKDDTDRGDPIGDLSDLRPTKAQKPDLRVVDEVATANGFPSRAPQMYSPKRQVRRERTGRNCQLNVRISQASLDAFVEISNRRKWIFSQTIDALLEVFQAFESGRLVITGKPASTEQPASSGELASTEQPVSSWSPVSSWPPRL
jgi:hypothetical protein